MDHGVVDLDPDRIQPGTREGREVLAHDVAQVAQGGCWAMDAGAQAAEAEMEDQNYCERGGYLVGEKLPLAESASEFYLGIGEPLVGCTRLWCSLCQSWVQITPDEVAKAAGERVYSCKCSNRMGGVESVTLWGSRIAAADDREDHEFLLFPYHWGCRGHPIQTLPFELDGVRIDRGTDFDELVSKTLDGWCPELARPDDREHPNVWLLKLYARLTKTGLQSSIAEAVSRCLIHPSPRVRSAAILFFATLIRKLGDLREANRIVELAAGDRSLFRGIPDPLSQGSTLEDSLLRALGLVVCRDREGATHALEVARTILLQPGRNQALYWSVCSSDTDWFLENLESVVRANPQGLEELFHAISDFREFPILAARIARMECVEPDEVSRFAKKYLKGYDYLLVKSALERRNLGVATKVSGPEDTEKQQT